MATKVNEDENAKIVKALHKSLRSKLKHGIDPDKLWCDLLHDKELLKVYSKAMFDLASKQWSNKHDENRVNWCLIKSMDYFRNGGLTKFSRKLYKTKLYADFSVEADEQNVTVEKINKLVADYKHPWASIFDDNLLVLDVGSCYNAFGENNNLMVIPIDISPAIPQVFYFDFLNATIKSITCEDKQNLSKDELVSSVKNQTLIENVYDIVIFSLLLSYFPSAHQRLKCCINAHKVLQTFGLLLIITPDSSHQNRHVDMMKSWREALEGIGFIRWKYEKLQHLHCMAFTKIDENINYVKVFEKYKNNLYIPQDFQIETESEEDNLDFSYVKYDTTVFKDIN